MNPKIIKTGICKSSSGQSTLTYNIAKVGSDIQFQIEANTGTGFFSKEWISLKDIQDAITKDKPFTSTVLYPLFQGKSINTAAFLMAVLLDLGLVKRSKRCYEIVVDPSDFMDSLKPPAKTKTATKTTAKAKSAPKTQPKIVPKTAPKQPTR